MSNERVVVTGGRGFVGSYLRRELARHWQGVQIEVWDLPEVDITKPDHYQHRLEEFKPTWLVHLAAISSVPAATRDPALAYRVNVEATQNILTQLEEVSSQTKVFVTSTADIYGQGSPTPLPELPLEEAHPKNSYAQSKWEMEKMVRDRFAKRVVRVRPFPHIGPGQGLGFVTADFAAQIAKIERDAASREAPKERSGMRAGVIYVGNLTARRDFTDVRDVVRAYRLLMEHGQLGEVYHVASGRGISIQKVLDTLLSLSTAVIQVEQDSTRMRAQDIPVLVGDATRLRETTGWEPIIPLRQTLQEILDWWREHYKR
ncbi:MAG: GDP-mannose 4,6-dehydratase [Patescibacteria group bacterium]